MRLFKSRKTYYFYNPNTLNYERVYPSAKDKFFSILKHLTTGIAFGVATFFVMLYLIDSPMESQLRKENKLLQTQYEVLSLRLNSALEVLNDIQVRDEKLYRAIFQAEPIPESVRQSGFGGSNRYEHLLTLSNSELIVSTTQKLDMLRKQLYIESNSLNELIEMGKNQEERNRCIPAIQPIANKDLRRTASGYGMRIHPIYRTKRFHSGMDFSANVGTEIYATGDGKVTYASWKQGYGNCIIIDHGFGYQTVYALNEGSVAAPTAGLHFTEEILSRLAKKGVEIGYVTLNVGLGTFRPVKCENVLEHKMDSETFEIPQETAELINRAKAQGKKIVAVVI